MIKAATHCPHLYTEMQKVNVNYHQIVHASDAHRKALCHLVHRHMATFGRVSNNTLGSGEYHTDITRYVSLPMT